MIIKKTKQIAGIILLSGLVFAGAQGQDDKLTREMTLEREYDPTIQDANKVNRLPEVKEPEITRRTIEYSPFTIPANPDKEIIILPSGEIMTAIPTNQRRGYFNFGGGMFMNLNGDLGYHFINDEKDKLNFYFSHRSTNGNVEYLQLPGVKAKAVLNDNLAVLDFKHIFNAATLRVGGNFGYTLFNYYGFPVYWNPLSSYRPPNPDILPDSLVDRKTNQANQTINAYAGIQSKEGTRIGYLLDFDFLRFDQKYGDSKDIDGVGENKYTVRLGLSSQLGYSNQRIGIAGKLEYFNHKYPTSYDPFYWNNNYYDLTVTPYYQTGKDNWKARLGVNVIYTSNEFTNRNFIITPDVAIEAEVAEKTVFYVNAGGYIQSNDSYGVSKQNRYMMNSLVSPSLTWLDGMMGIRSGVVPGLWFDIFAGYRITENEVFYLPSSYTQLIETGFAGRLYDSPMDASVFRAGATLKYMYRKWVDFSVKGVYSAWSFSMPEGTDGGSQDYYKNAKPWGRPAIEVNADLTIRPLNPMALTLGYYLGAERYTHIGQEIKMKDINDLSFRASWNFNETFGAYLKLNNLLFQKQEWYYGYPVQSFSAMVGINLNF